MSHSPNRIVDPQTRLRTAVQLDVVGGSPAAQRIEAVAAAENLHRQDIQDLTIVNRDFTTFADLQPEL